MAVDLVFETHATTEDNEKGIATGWNSARLSATGREQAHLLGERRSNGSPSSELRRDEHVDTPYPAGESWRAAITRVGGFLQNLGPWSGTRVLVVGHIATKFAFDHFLNDVPIEELLSTPFIWQEGWKYEGWEYEGWEYEGWEFEGWKYEGWEFEGWKYEGWNYEAATDSWR
jgi:broad specificity phosphatase PhoE